MAATSDNSFSAHTLGCTSGSIRLEFAPRLTPRDLRAAQPITLFGGGFTGRDPRNGRGGDVASASISTELAVTRRDTPGNDRGRAASGPPDLSSVKKGKAG